MSSRCGAEVESHLSLFIEVSVHPLSPKLVPTSPGAALAYACLLLLQWNSAFFLPQANLFKLIKYIGALFIGPDGSDPWWLSFVFFFLPRLCYKRPGTKGEQSSSQF